MAGPRDADLRIGPELSIPAGELSFETSRSGGPGGQNVNKVETRVSLRFNVLASPSLDERTRAWLSKRLAAGLTSAGEIVVHASRFRSQSRNLDDARERLAEILRTALVRPRPRKATRPTRGAKERRLTEKRQRSQVKRNRASNEGD